MKPRVDLPAKAIEIASAVIMESYRRYLGRVAQEVTRLEKRDDPAAKVRRQRLEADTAIEEEMVRFVLTMLREQPPDPPAFRAPERKWKRKACGVEVECEKPTVLESCWCEEHYPYRCVKCGKLATNCEPMFVSDTDGDLWYCDEHNPEKEKP